MRITTGNGFHYFHFWKMCLLRQTVTELQFSAQDTEIVGALHFSWSE